MDPNNTHEVIFWDNLYKLRPWLYMMKIIRDFQGILIRIQGPWNWENLW